MTEPRWRARWQAKIRAIPQPSRRALWTAEEDRVALGDGDVAAIARLLGRSYDGVTARRRRLRRRKPLMTAIMGNDNGGTPDGHNKRHSHEP